MDLNEIESQFPLHFHIWNNSIKELKKCLDTEIGQSFLEQRDIRNRTPLMLSVSLGHFECVKLLLGANANVNIDDNYGFNVLHEAIATNDPELVQMVMEKRDAQRASKRLHAIPQLLRKIRDTQDFYVEMKWEFTSWVPLVSRFCPSDTYKIYKSGSSVRVDTTLSGFEHMSWQRGSRTYIFQAFDDGAKFIDIDHDNHQAHIETMMLSELTEPINQLFSTSSDVMAQARLTCPTSITYLDTEKIHFDRSKSGIIGFRSEKTETINGYECKVFSATNVQLVTKIRTEHLSDQDKQNYKEQLSSQSIPFQSLLGTVEVVEKTEPLKVDEHVHYNICNPGNISLEQYFDEKFDMNGKDIGRPKELTTRVNRFKANMWLSEQFPLSLQEQVLPIIDLMAINSSHFAKLKDFITLKIPNGFPIKIEIPLFHIVNARITFGNIFSLNESVEGVKPMNDKKSVTCVVDESIFNIPNHYSYLGNDDDFVRPRHIEEIDYLRMQNSLNRTRSLRSTLDENSDRTDPDLQRAIEESLKDMQADQQIIPEPVSSESSFSSISPIMVMSPTTDSQLNENNEQVVNSHNEQEVLDRVLKLSLIEK